MYDPYGQQNDWGQQGYPQQPPQYPLGGTYGYPDYYPPPGGSPYPQPQPYGYGDYQNPQQPYYNPNDPYGQNPQQQSPNDPYGQYGCQEPYGQQQWQDPFGQQLPAAPEEEAPKKAKKGKKKRKGKEKELKPEKPPTVGGKIAKMCLNAFYWIICIAIVAGSVMFALSKDTRKSYLGYRFYNVLTESMTPVDGAPAGGFYKGDMVISKMVTDANINTISVGDIITYNPSAGNTENTAFLTHRVVEVLSERGGVPGLYFQTKGDANPSVDPPISAEQVIGVKVGLIPKVGGVLRLLRENFILTIVMVVSLFGCILMFRWYFSKPKPPEGQTELVQQPKGRQKNPEPDDDSGYGSPPFMRTAAFPERSRLYINQT